uniref:Putative ovule protein n=1 Tax=Solanum chacoense TaxID=4108 RepID=A0A0V0GW65_SOLCH
MSVCCLLSTVNFDFQGMLMTHGLGCRYFLLICWLIVLFMITYFISEHEMLVVVLRSEEGNISDR